MKRDPELIRKLLIAIENSPPEGLSIPPLPFEDYSLETVVYHIELLRDANFVEASIWSGFGRAGGARVKRLKWDGTEFLDSIRNDNIWEKAKEYSLATAGVITIETLKLAVSVILKNLIT